MSRPVRKRRRDSEDTTLWDDYVKRQKTKIRRMQRQAVPPTHIKLEKREEEEEEEERRHARFDSDPDMIDLSDFPQLGLRQLAPRSPSKLASPAPSIEVL